MKNFQAKFMNKQLIGKLLSCTLFLLLALTVSAQQQKNFNDLWHPAKKKYDKRYPHKVVLFEHPEQHKGDGGHFAHQKTFAGPSKEGETKLYPTLGNMDNKCSAIYVPRGYEITVYENSNYTGRQYIFTEGYYPFLDVSKDMITTMKVRKLLSTEFDEFGPKNAAYFFRNSNHTDWWPTAQGLTPRQYKNHHTIDCWDCFNYIYIRGDFEVVAWEHDNMEGKNNAEHPWRDIHDGKGTYYTPTITGFNNQINSLTITQTGWEFVDIEFTELSKTINNDLSPLGAGVIAKGNIAATVGLKVEKSYQQTWQHTFEHKFGVDVSISNEFSAGADIILAQAISKQKIEVKAHTHFSNKWARGTAEKNVAGLSISTTIPPNCDYKCDILARPMRVIYKTSTTFKRVDDKGNDIVLSNGKTPTKVIQGLFRVDDFTDFMAVWNSNHCGEEIKKVANNEKAVQTAEGNLALNGLTKSSSNFHGKHFASFGVDGDYRDRHVIDDKTKRPVGYFHSNQEDYPWWEVDLGEVCDIKKINLYNVTDEYKDRLTNLYIKVSEVPFTNNNDGNAVRFAGPVTPGLIGTYLGDERGRYVRIYLDKKAAVLNFCEVEVIGKPVDGYGDQTAQALEIDETAGRFENVAKNKIAKMSSEWDANHAAKNAVDGNRRDRHDKVPYVHTKKDNEPWWEVDLGEDYDIKLIEVYNVTDEYGARLMNLNIKTSKTPFKSNEDGTFYAKNVYPDDRGQYFGDAVGRYVRIYVPKEGYLNFCEVEVRGTPVSANSTASSGGK